jgi:hypothetical protein
MSGAVPDTRKFCFQWHKLYSTFLGSTVSRTCEHHISSGTLVLISTELLGGPISLEQYLSSQRCFSTEESRQKGNYIWPTLTSAKTQGSELEGIFGNLFSATSVWLHFMEVKYVTQSSSMGPWSSSFHWLSLGWFQVHPSQSTNKKETFFSFWYKFSFF